MPNVRRPAARPPVRPASTVPSTPAAGTGAATTPAADTAPDTFTPVGPPTVMPSPGPAPGGASPLSVRLASTTGAPLAQADSAVDAKLQKIKDLLVEPVSREAEGKVLDLLKDTSATELDALIARLDLHELVENLEDHWFGADNREGLFELLARERVSDLRPATRARVVTALQKGSTTDDKERAIRDVFLATRGAELTALKNAIDAGGDSDDLVKLLHSDIDDGAIRDAIVSHIAHESGASSTGRVKVLSDIDDTLYANWVDARYPKKTVYPGVRAFYRELSGVTPSPDAPETHVTFLTARPDERTGLVEEMTHGTVRDLGVGEATVLAGAITHLHNNDAIADKKYENFERYSALYPEYGAVFIGDSGQGDAILAARMAAGHPSKVKGTFIHDVVGLPEDKRAELRAAGVVVFDTYAGAALEAHQLGLLDDEGLARVVQAAVADFVAVGFADDAQRSARRGELTRDVAAVNAALPAGLQVDVSGL